MIRKMKVIGLAVVAVLALTAVSASAASAAEFHSEVSSTKLEGSQTTANIFAITGTSVKTTCAVATFAGTQTGLTSPTATVHPTYSGTGGGKCELSPLGEAEVVTGTATAGCNYVLNATSGAVEIECTSGKSIEIKAPGCTIKIAGGQTVNGVTYTNTGSGTTRGITVTANVSGIAYTSSGLLCGTFGISSSGTNSTYTGAVAVKGFNTTGGAQVGIFRE
jgi:hypothetical protein